MKIEAPTRDVTPGYERLAAVLSDAFDHAAHGKGQSRHANGQAFHEQPMQRICEMYGMAFATGQAAKKAQEAHRLPPHMARAELLGAINYLAGAVIYLDNREAAQQTTDPHAATPSPSVIAEEQEFGGLCGNCTSVDPCLQMGRCLRGVPVHG